MVAVDIGKNKREREGREGPLNSSPVMASLGLVVLVVEHMQKGIEEREKRNQKGKWRVVGS